MFKWVRRVSFAKVFSNGTGNLSVAEIPGLSKGHKPVAAVRKFPFASVKTDSTLGTLRTNSRVRVNINSASSSPRHSGRGMEIIMPLFQGERPAKGERELE